MSKLWAAVLIAASIACASTGSVGQSKTFYAEKNLLLFAAEDAIKAMGGRVSMSNQSMGTVVGRFAVEGTPVQLNVQIAGSPSPDANTIDFFDVSAAASLVGDRDPDEEWRRQLRWFEEEFLRVMSAAVPERTRPRVP